MKYIAIILLFIANNITLFAQVNRITEVEFNGDSTYSEIDLPLWDEKHLNNDTTYVDTIFYSNNNIKLITNIVSGKIVFKQEYYANGKLWKEASFKEGELDGVQKEWWLNGNVKSIYYWSKGLQVRECKEWYENGKIKLKSVSKDTLRFVVTYYENGTIQSEYFTSQEMHYLGIEKFYCDNGTLVTTRNHDEEVSYRKFYHCNGKIWKEGKMKYNLIWIGPYKEYYDNGQLKVRGTFRNLEFENEEVREGKWEYYSEQGKLIKTEFWSNGGLKETIEYDDNW